MQSFNFGAVSTSSVSEEELKEKDKLIEQLMREVVELRQKVLELQRQHETDLALINSLKYQITKLEEEIAEYKDIAAQACDENVALKSQLAGTRTTEEMQAAEAAKLKTVEEKFVKMKQMYGNLRKEHVDLLKQQSEMTKQVSTLSRKVEDSETLSKSFESRVSELEEEIERSRAQAVLAESVPTLQAALEEQQRAAELFVSEKIASERQMSDDRNMERHDLLIRAVKEARSLILQAQEQCKSDHLSDSSCSPEYLASQVEGASQIAERLQVAACLYAANREEVGDAVAALSGFASSISNVVVLSRSASNMASEEAAGGKG
jgi:huntingtin interacting protein 1